MVIFPSFFPPWSIWKEILYGTDGHALVWLGRVVVIRSASFASNRSIDRSRELFIPSDTLVASRTFRLFVEKKVERVGLMITSVRFVALVRKYEQIMIWCLVMHHRVW